MSVYGRILLAVFGSAALLLGALAFQFIGDLLPCPLCIWQRWPHLVAIAIGLLTMTVLWRVRRALSWLGGATMAVSAGLGIYHVGVEQKLWSSGCSGIDPSKVSSEELIKLFETANQGLKKALEDPDKTYQGQPLIPCDAIPWEWLSISMAGWNAIISVGLAALWVFAALPKKPTPFEVPG